MLECVREFSPEGSHYFVWMSDTLMVFSLLA